MFKQKYRDFKEDVTERIAAHEIKKSVKKNPYAYGFAGLGALVFVLVYRSTKLPTNVTIINTITPSSHNQ